MGKAVTHGARPFIGRPRALSADQIALAERMRASGEPVPLIAETLDVSRATVYRVLAEQTAPGGLIDGQPAALKGHVEQRDADRRAQA